MHGNLKKRNSRTTLLKQRRRKSLVNSTQAGPPVLSSFERRQVDAVKTELTSPVRLANLNQFPALDTPLEVDLNSALALSHGRDRMLIYNDLFDTRKMHISAGQGIGRRDFGLLVLAALEKATVDPNSLLYPDEISVAIDEGNDGDAIRSEIEDVLGTVIEVTIIGPEEETELGRRKRGDSKDADDFDAAPDEGEELTRPEDEDDGLVPSLKRSRTFRDVPNDDPGSLMDDNLLVDQQREQRPTDEEFSDEEEGENANPRKRQRDEDEELDEDEIIEDEAGEDDNDERDADDDRKRRRGDDDEEEDRDDDDEDDQQREEEDEETPEELEQEQNLVGKYAASLILNRPGATSISPDQVEVSGIQLPQYLRPPTQYGAKQMAHTVSWTLLKQAYANLFEDGAVNLRNLIENYLRADWQRLREQANLGKVPEAHRRFLGYLNKYPDSFFEDLLNDEKTLLQWIGLVQQLVTDYFVAVQLAPLSTHTGFTGKKSIVEAQPSGHGEPAANRYFRSIERADIEGDNLNVLTYARKYWDSGTNFPGGLQSDQEIRLAKVEFFNAFSRAFPTTWNAFGNYLRENLTSDEPDARFPFPTSTLNVEAETDPAILNETGGFQAGILLDQTGDRLSAEQFQIDAINIDELMLPNDRPVTKYGPAGQQSHTVSWTLVIQALGNISSGTNLNDFLQHLLHQWKALEVQNWMGLFSARLITNTDFERSTGFAIDQLNQRNAQRLRLLHRRMNDNIRRINSLLAGEQLSDGEWAALVQKLVADYVLVYQSAPLSSYKAGRPLVHGEPDSNQFFSVLEADGAEDPSVWTTKFRNLMVDEIKARRRRGNILSSHLDGKRMVPDRQRVLTILNKIEDEDSLDEQDFRFLQDVLVLNLAANYLDAKWTAVDNPAEMAMIMVEWEESLQAAFPQTWRQFGAMIQRFSDSRSLSSGLQEVWNQANLRPFLIEERNKRERRRGYIRAQGHRATDNGQLPLGSPLFQLGFQDYVREVQEGYLATLEGRLLSRAPGIEMGVQIARRRQFEEGAQAFARGEGLSLDAPSAFIQGYTNARVTAQAEQLAPSPSVLAGEASGLEAFLSEFTGEAGEVDQDDAQEDFLGFNQEQSATFFGEDLDEAIGGDDNFFT